MKIKGTHQLAARLDVNVSTVYRWQHRADFPRRKEDDINIFEMDEVLAWLHQHSLIPHRKSLETGETVTIARLARIIGLSRHLLLRYLKRGLPHRVQGRGNIILNTSETIAFFEQQATSECRRYATRLRAFREKGREAVR